MRQIDQTEQPRDTNASPRDGWAIPLADRRELARFAGLGTKRRALRHLASDKVMRDLADA